MSGFFSHSSSRRRYPNPNMGGNHYRKKGLFGMLSGLGSSFSSPGHGGYYGQSQRAFQPAGPAAGQAVCPKCGVSVPAGSKFCLSCGEKMTANAVFCPNCGKPLPAGAKFCSECGTPIQR